MDHDAKVRRWKEKMVDLLSDEKLEAALDSEKMKRSRTVRIYKSGNIQDGFQFDVCGSWFSKVNRLRKQLESEYGSLEGSVYLSPVARSAEYYFKSQGIEKSKVEKMMEKMQAGKINYEVDQPVTIPEEWKEANRWPH